MQNHNIVIISASKVENKTYIFRYFTCLEAQNFVYISLL